MIKEKKIFNQYNRAVFEPLIQHYGVKTPYIDLVDKSHAKDYFAKMKQLWQDHDLLIVEGKYSRSGEGMTCFLMLDQLVDSFVRQLMHIVAKKLLKMKLLKMQLIG